MIDPDRIHMIAGMASAVILSREPSSGKRVEDALRLLGELQTEVKQPVKITVRYGDDGEGNDEPGIEVEGLPRSAYALVFIDEGEDVWLFMEYCGLSIYRTEKDNDAWADNWFSTQRGMNWNVTWAFDWQKLPDVPEFGPTNYDLLFPGDEIKQRIAYAIDKGYLTSAEPRGDYTGEMTAP